MAIFKGAIAAEIRGSINGTTFSRNKSGAYMRNRTVPVNPNSSRQLYIREAMSQAAFAWSTVLTEGQRNAWRLYASTTPVTNRLGDSINLSGFNMYCRAATFLAYATGSIAAAATAPPSPGLAAPIAFDELNLHASDSTTPNILAGVLESPSEGIVEAGVAMFWISPPLSQGTAFYKGPWIPLAGPMSTTAYPAITVPVGFDLSTSENRFLRWRFLDQENKMSAEAIFGPVNIVSL